MKAAIKKIIPGFLLNLYYLALPLMGAVLYGRPSRRIKVIGITGTNGKTTVTHLTSHILEQAGFKVASISSLRFKVGEREWVNELKMTMPGRMSVQKFLRRAADEECDFCVMEVTSEGIKQKRHKFINFDTSVFTNLTPEHIESHGSFEAYRDKKGEFFAVPHNISIVNSDDKYAEYFLSFDASKKITYSAKDINGAHNLLPGDFNRANIAAATAIALTCGVEDATIKKAIQLFKGVPGRMELVVEKPFKVFVDYAHTPDALQKVYKSLTADCQLSTANCRLIAVLGSAGGGRDKWKRPEFAKLAAQYADYTILTDEDPYDENPEKILDQIEKGFDKVRTYSIRMKGYKKILDRREAIRFALSNAKAGDIVVITGKGAEPWMVTAHGKVPWDDRKIVREELAKTQG